MTNIRWTKEQDALVRLLYPNPDWKTAEITSEINRIHGTSYNTVNVSTRATNMGLRRPAYRPGVTWTDTMNATLREALDNRKKYSVIGQMMGLTVSAISTQVARLGIHIPKGKRFSPEEVIALRTKKDDRKAAAKMEARLDHLLNFVPLQYRIDAPLPVIIDPVGDPLNLTMEEVGHNQCRYITTEPPAAPLYCGHGTGYLSSWCGRHRKLTMRGPPKKLPKLPQLQEYSTPILPHGEKYQTVSKTHDSQDQTIVSSPNLALAEIY